GRSYSRATSLPRDRRSLSWDRPATVPDRTCTSRCASQACRSIHSRSSNLRQREVVDSQDAGISLPSGGGQGGGTQRKENHMVNRVILVGRPNPHRVQFGPVTLVGRPT